MSENTNNVTVVEVVEEVKNASGAVVYRKRSDGNEYWYDGNGNILYSKHNGTDDLYYNGTIVKSVSPDMEMNFSNSGKMVYLNSNEAGELWLNGGDKVLYKIDEKIIAAFDRDGSVIMQVDIEDDNISYHANGKLLMLIGPYYTSWYDESEELRLIKYDTDETTYKMVNGKLVQV
jgi:hypothetical protein